MYYKDNIWTYSPSDLTAFMDSSYASWMNRYAILFPDFKKNKDPEDKLLKKLQEKGNKHEAEVLGKSFTDQSIIDIAKIELNGRDKFQAQNEATIQAMHSGVEVIYQAALSCDSFSGYADFLVKVEGASALGDFHYEVWDSKLASSVKPYFVVQLCCYAEMLERIQKVLPQNITVVLGTKNILGENDQKQLKTNDYFYYYLALKDKFLRAKAAFDPEIKPHPFDSKSYGSWSKYAENELAESDHLSLIANITRNQIKKLEHAGIKTCAELIAHTGKVSKLNPQILERLQKQANLQKASAGQRPPKYEILPHDPSKKIGFASLPPESKSDVFFDIEGYPLIEGGLEYLWGNTYFDESGQRQFKDFWAHNSEQEKEAFRQFIQWVYKRWQIDPTMHIYHYASYEITACRKLAGRCSQFDEFDELLRNEVFVDLYKVVKNGMMVGESSYSIKKIEHLYRGDRNTEVGQGSDSIVAYEEWRELWLMEKGSDDWQQNETLKNIRDYNIDDCDSTQELAAWLRARQEEAGISYREKSIVEPPKLKMELKSRAILRTQLLDKAREEVDNKNIKLSELYLQMSMVLDFHHREEKPMWWRLYDRLGTTPDELLDDIDCLAYCERTQRAPFKNTSREQKLYYEYSFSTAQEWKTGIKKYYIYGEVNTDGQNVSVDVDRETSDLDRGLIVIREKNEPADLIHLLINERVPSSIISDAIQRVAAEFSEHGVTKKAILDFLKKDIPRIKYLSKDSAIVTAQDPQQRLQQVINAVENLDNSYLTIQGPPGTGKTYTAKHIISHLLKLNKKIGIASNSHKVINNLLLGVAEYCNDENIAADFFCNSETDEARIKALGVQVIENSDIPLMIENGACVVGTTAWGFSKKELINKFDYLFIDEAGQVAVANLIGMSQSAHNLVLMGDQMQLGQPSQGVHLGESGLSILDYLLGDTPAIDPKMGVFLGTTYRMHSKVNQFISDAVYDGQLISNPDNDKQTLLLNKAASDSFPTSSGHAAGIVFAPVEHHGNTISSEEEVQEIKRLVTTLLGSDYTDKDGVTKKVTLDDMLFVAPYNMQVELLKKTLGAQAKVGSVDKFQGQEAPIVFFSLCTSDAAETPRGIDFLYSKNRINVAISRAQALAIVVGSPDLFCPAINSVEQMKKVNLVSRLKNYQC